MPGKEGVKKFEWLLQDRNTVGAGLLEQVTAGKFNVKCWSADGSNDFDGASVRIQIKTEDDRWVTTYTFSVDGVQFGEIGTGSEIFRAFILTPGAKLLSCTITYE